MKIKKGKLNYDQSGRAYPDNPRLKENWDSIWEYEGKYYKLVGGYGHKEWSEVNIYNQMIDGAYENYCNAYPDVEKTFQYEGSKIEVRKMTQEEFIEMIKTDDEFSERWGLKIEERELSLEERNYSLGQGKAYKGIFGRSGKNDLEYKELFDRENRPNKLITITYNNEKIEVYE